MAAAKMQESSHGANDEWIYSFLFACEMRSGRMGTMALDRSKYGSKLRKFLEVSELPPLGGGESLGVSKAELSELEEGGIFEGIAVKDVEMARCCLSGIQLLHGELDVSHRISQSVETTTGSYWHGIMHRREGDFGNSKYWFRKVGRHSIHPDLTEAARGLAEQEQSDSRLSFLCRQKQWDAAGFVDLCEDVVVNDGGGDGLCRAIQMIEWELLFEYSFGKATGGA